MLNKFQIQLLLTPQHLIRAGIEKLHTTTRLPHIKIRGIDGLMNLGHPHNFLAVVHHTAAHADDTPLLDRFLQLPGEAGLTLCIKLELNLLVLHIEGTLCPRHRYPAVIYRGNTHSVILRGNGVKLQLQRSLKGIPAENLAIGRNPLPEIAALYADGVEAGHIVLSLRQQELRLEGAELAQRNLAGLQIFPIRRAENEFCLLLSRNGAAAIGQLVAQNTAHIDGITGAVQGAVQHQHGGLPAAPGTGTASLAVPQIEQHGIIPAAHFHQTIDGRIFRQPGNAVLHGQLASGSGFVRVCHRAGLHRGTIRKAIHQNSGIAHSHIQIRNLHHHILLRIQRFSGFLVQLQRTPHPGICYRLQAQQIRAGSHRAADSGIEREHGLAALQQATGSGGKLHSGQGCGPRQHRSAACCSFFFFIAQTNQLVNIL